MATRYSDNGREYKPHDSTSVTRIVVTISAFFIGIGVAVSCNPDESTGSIILAFIAGVIAFVVYLCICNVYLNMSDDIKRMSDIIDELDEKVLYQNNMLADLLSQEQKDRRKMYKTQIRFYNDTIRSMKNIQTEVRRLSYELDVMSFREGTPEYRTAKNNTPGGNIKDGIPDASAGNNEYGVPGSAASEKPETGYDETDKEASDDHTGYAESHDVKDEEYVYGAKNDDLQDDIEYDGELSSDDKGNNASTEGNKAE